MRATLYGVSLRMQPRKRSLPSLVRMHHTMGKLLWPCAVLQAVAATVLPVFRRSPGRLSLHDPASASVREHMQACQEQPVRMASLAAALQERRRRASLLRHPRKLQQRLTQQHRWPPSSQLWLRGPQLGRSLR